jgi:hypothetical protein
MLPNYAYLVLHMTTKPLSIVSVFPTYQIGLHQRLKTVRSSALRRIALCNINILKPVTLVYWLELGRSEVTVISRVWQTSPFLSQSA